MKNVAWYKTTILYIGVVNRRDVDVVQDVKVAQAPGGVEGQPKVCSSLPQTNTCYATTTQDNTLTFACSYVLTQSCTRTFLEHDACSHEIRLVSNEYERDELPVLAPDVGQSIDGRLERVPVFHRIDDDIGVDLFRRHELIKLKLQAEN